jgi:hypothetical protein
MQDIPVTCREAADNIWRTKCILLLHFLDDRTIVNEHCYGTTQQKIKMIQAMSPNFFCAGNKRGWTISQ